MPLFLRGKGGTAPVRLTSEWHHLAGLPAGSLVRIRELEGAHAAASLENCGQTGIHVEVLQEGGAYQLADYIDAGESGLVGANTRLFVSGHPDTTAHYLTACSSDSDSGEVVILADTGAATRAEEGSSKRRASSATGARTLGDGNGRDSAAGGSKRQRVGTSAGAGLSSSPGGIGEAAVGAMAAAAAAAGTADPLDRIPDAPMHLMRVRDIPDWANEGFLGVKLTDLVRGDMKWCLCSNYMLDLGWLLSACPDLQRCQRLLLVHGEHHPVVVGMIKEAIAEAGLQDTCTVFVPNLPIQYGTHHSKAFVIEYARGVRVIIYTANAIYPDCNNKTQGLWKQLGWQNSLTQGLFWQDFPPKDPQSPPTSPFQQDLAAYLAELRLPPTSARYCRELLERHDFSAARAHVVASVPGYHKGQDMYKWGHLRLRSCLNREPPFPTAFRGAPLVAQFSSLGSLQEKWLEGEFRESMAAGRCGDGRERLGMPAAGPPGMQLVWATVGEVQNSIEGWKAGHSIPGPAKNVDKPFLKPYYRKWGGEVCGRQRAMPHIKSYLRYQGQDIAWLYVGSHNLSKAAWGELQKKGEQLMVRSYELGVLLLPSLEAAYRASRWRGFSCTSASPMPSSSAAIHAQGAGAAAAAAAGAPDAATGAAGGSAAAGAATATAAAAGAGSVRFVAWQRGSSQEAEAGQAGDEGVLCVPLPVPFCLPPQRYGAGERAWSVDTVWPGLDSLGCSIHNPRGANYGNVE